MEGSRLGSPMFDEPYESQAADSGDDDGGPHLTQIASQERDVPGEFTIGLHELAGGVLGTAPYPPSAAAPAAGGAGSAASSLLAIARTPVDWAAVQAQALSQAPVGPQTAGGHGGAAEPYDYGSNSEVEEVGGTPPTPAARQQAQRAALEARMVELPPAVGEAPATPARGKRPRSPEPGERTPTGKGGAAAPPTPEAKRRGAPRADIPTKELAPKKGKTPGGKAAAKPPAKPVATPGTLEAAFAHGTGRTTRSSSKPPLSPTTTEEPAPGAGSPTAASSTRAKPAPAAGAKPAAETGAGGRTTLQGAVAARLTGLSKPAADRRSGKGAGGKGPMSPRK